MVYSLLLATLGALEPKGPCTVGGTWMPTSGLRIIGFPAAAHRTMASEATKRFGVALRELLIEHDYSTRSGNPNWRAFAAELDGIHYETLRKAVVGERRPSWILLEECARALRLRPEYFSEYRLYLAQRDFDPDAVGFDRAVRNLQLWVAAADQPESPLKRVVRKN
jgi:hypothetical protein